MRSIFLKELNSFLSSLSGYIVFILFIIAAGLFLWVLPDTNIMDYGYASLDQFFQIAPWLFMFLIPAITMRTFSEEFSRGTIEWLFTKPINNKEIIGGKFLASFALVIIALIPTLLYIISVNYLSIDASTLDAGATFGAYLGLVLLAASFTSIGVFCSSLTENQIVSFLTALFVSFIFYSGFEAFSRINTFRGGADYYLALLGMDFHFTNMSTGLINTMDLIYFISLTGLFLYLTHFSLSRRKLKS